MRGDFLGGSDTGRAIFSSRACLVSVTPSIEQLPRQNGITLEFNKLDEFRCPPQAKLKRRVAKTGRMRDPQWHNSNGMLGKMTYL